jgi:hypothetical protein
MGIHDWLLRLRWTNEIEMTSIRGSLISTKSFGFNTLIFEVIQCFFRMKWLILWIMVSSGNSRHTVQNSSEGLCRTSGHPMPTLLYLTGRPTYAFAISIWPNQTTYSGGCPRRQLVDALLHVFAPSLYLDKAPDRKCYKLGWGVDEQQRAVSFAKATGGSFAYWV